MGGRSSKSNHNTHRQLRNSSTGVTKSGNLIPDGFIAMTKRSSEEVHQIRHRPRRTVSLVPNVDIIHEDGEEEAAVHVGIDNPDKQENGKSSEKYESEAHKASLSPTKGPRRPGSQQYHDYSGATKNMSREPFPSARVSVYPHCSGTSYFLSISFFVRKGSLLA